MVALPVDNITAAVLLLCLSI